MAFTPYYHSISPTIIPGCQILAKSPAASVAITNATSPVTVFDGFSGTDLIVAPNNYNPDFPLLLKLFFSGVTTNTTDPNNYGFAVRIAGPFDTYQFQRMDSKDFGTTKEIVEWSTMGAIAVTVTLIPITTSVTTVSCSCMAGLAMDAIDMPGIR
jgi:hypothetical protein